MTLHTTTLPSYLDTIVAQSESFYKDFTNLLDLFGDYTNEINLNIDFAKAKSSNNVFKETANIFKTLNDNEFKINDVELNQDSVEYYIEKFLSLNQKFQLGIQVLLDLEGEKNNVYFKNMSDDIGYITNQATLYDDSTNPYFDIQSKIFVNPLNIGSSIYNKTTTTNQLLQMSYSKYNNGLMKNSLSGLDVSDVANINSSSHGTNLAIDYGYIKRHLSLSNPVQTKIVDILKGLGSYLLYIKNQNNRDTLSEKNAIFLAFEFNLNDNINSVDILLNKYTSNPVLNNNNLVSDDSLI